MKNNSANKKKSALHMLFNAHVIMNSKKTEEKFGPFTPEEKNEAKQQYQTEVFRNAWLAGYLR